MRLISSLLAVLAVSLAACAPATVNRATNAASAKNNDDCAGSQSGAGSTGLPVICNGGR